MIHFFWITRPPCLARGSGRLAATMVAVILAFSALAVDLLDPEHHPLGIAAIVFAVAGAAAVVVSRWPRPPS